MKRKQCNRFQHTVLTQVVLTRLEKQISIKEAHLKQADRTKTSVLSVETPLNSCVSREVPARTVLMLINFIHSDFISFWITDNNAGKGKRLEIDSEKMKTGFTDCFVKWDITKGHVKQNIRLDIWILRESLSQGYLHLRRLACALLPQ